MRRVNLLKINAKLRIDRQSCSRSRTCERGRSRWATRSAADIYWQAMMCVAATEREREGGRRGELMPTLIAANAREKKEIRLCVRHMRQPPLSPLRLDLSLIVRLIEAQIHLRT